MALTWQLLYAEYKQTRLLLSTFISSSINKIPHHLINFKSEYVNSAAIRSRYFSASSMKDVFENVNAQSVIDFTKEIHFFYHKL